jgi:hypothetical protein
MRKVINWVLGLGIIAVAGLIAKYRMKWWPSKNMHVSSEAQKIAVQHNAQTLDELRAAQREATRIIQEYTRQEVINEFKDRFGI